MADVLADAVGAALASVAGVMPKLSMTMKAGFDTGTVVLCSSVDEGTAGASAGGVNGTRRVVAKTADFPALSVAQPVSIGGSRHIIVGLKKTGDAAWFADLSSPLVPVEAKIKIDGAVYTFTAMCAVVDDMAYSTTIGASSHSVCGEPVTVFIPFEEWNSSAPPAFGTRLGLSDGRSAVVQDVDKMEYSWRCEAVAKMAGIVK